MPSENLEAVILTLDESLFTAFRSRFAETGVSISIASSPAALRETLVRENVSVVVLDAAHTQKILGLSVEQAVVKFSPLLAPRVIAVLAEPNLPAEQIVRLLKLGAHDVVTKPVRPRIFAEQLKALVRVFSSGKKRDERKIFSQANSLVMDYPRRRCLIKDPAGGRSCADREVRLTKTEFQVLYFLLQKKGALVTYEDFREHLWPTACSSKEIIHTLHQLTTNIRKKIEPCPVKIENLRAEGFRLAWENGASSGTEDAQE